MCFQFRSICDEVRITRIEGIASIKSSFALKQVRYKTALPLAHIEG